MSLPAATADEWKSIDVLEITYLYPVFVVDEWPRKGKIVSMKTSQQIESLNKLLADVHLVYVKLHNYHWNIKGKHFFGVHKTTQEYYEYFTELYDDLAERILQLGGKPLVTVKDYLATASLKEEAKTDFLVEDVVKGTVADFESLLEGFRGLLSASQENQDAGTEAMSADVIKWLEKAIWMLKATSEK